MDCSSPKIAHEVRVLPASESICKNISEGLGFLQQFDSQKDMKHALCAADEKTWILKYLYYAGIPIFSIQGHSRIYLPLYYWFPILMHIALFTNTALLVLESISGVYGMKIVLACACFNVLSVAVWHCTYQAKNKLIEVLVTMQKICSLNPEFAMKKAEVLLTNAVLLIFSLIPTAFSVMCLYLATDTSTDTFWTFGYKLEHFYPWGQLILFANVNLYVSLQVVFPGLMTCMYSTLCHRFSKLIIHGNGNFERRSEGTPETSCLKQKVVQYFDVLDGIESLQKTFSKPMFLLILMHLLHMFALLAYFLTFTKEQFTDVVIGESIVIMMTSSVSICAVVLFASKIPENIQRVRRQYQRYQENVVLKSLKKRDEVAQLVIDREIIVMSASDIVRFKKTFILSVFGALFDLRFINSSAS